MKVVVFGGSGLVGSKLVDRLRSRGHEAIAASRRSGVNTVTGEGLAEVLSGANTAVDVTNAPSFDEPEVVDFFRDSSRRLLVAEAAAGVSHHLALSVVGTERLHASGYFRAKLGQEDLIKHFDVPYTILRSTQFFEFMANIIPPGSGRESVYLSPALVQPVAADDVADLLVELVLATPSNTTLETAGPESYRLCDLVQWVMYVYQDDRPVVADKSASYYSGILDDSTLMPAGNALIARTHFKDWLDSYISRSIPIPRVHHPDPLSPG
ncbi:MAG TPA: SDR family oxidoreductase [Hyphomicrobiaceae bacterium]